MASLAAETARAWGWVRAAPCGRPPGQAGDGPVAVSFGRPGAGNSHSLGCPVRHRGQLEERGGLAGPELASRWPLPAGQRRRQGTTLGRQPQPALVARPGAGDRQVPVERQQPVGLERPKAADQAGASLGCNQGADGPRTSVDLLEEVPVRGTEAVRRLARPPLGDEVETFEEAGREHCPDDDRRRREIVIRDPSGEGE
jgi:hypothetical protein